LFLSNGSGRWQALGWSPGFSRVCGLSLAKARTPTQDLPAPGTDSRSAVRATRPVVDRSTWAIVPRSGTRLRNLHGPVGRHVLAFDAPAGRIKLHAHIDGQTLAQAEVALGLPGRIVTVKTLPAPDGHLLVSQQPPRLARFVQANLGPGGAGVAGPALQLHPEP